MSLPRRQFLRLAAGAAAFPAVTRFAAAQTYPTRTVKFILPFGPATHMYLQLFTSADVNSALALWQGLCWSLAFGLIGGALIALSYNLVASLDER